MVFNRPPGVVGGHGATRSVVAEYDPSARVGFTVDRPLDGFHEYVVLAVDEEHTLAILDPRSRSAHPDTRVADAPRRLPDGVGRLDGAIRVTTC